ncbi:MAG: aldehyde dehydrogenase family protein [Ilumatobacter coccineus]|uniref:Aldehyde dehydrogenase n=1 Tax=Ilumatobacter coccineus TaxID=467094 RepID=A0A2G6K7S6_9ACTN|nr:MAG: aldehyde dehydrogenase family protein [Ilumatobacter coccineus]
MLAPDVLASISASCDAVRAGATAGTLSSIHRRRDQLTRLRDLLVHHTDDLARALRADLGKSAHEAYTTEIGFTISEIDYALKHLKAWTSPRKVKLPTHQRPGTGQILPRPLGTVLIIAPWNYPVQLVLAPLIPALAAGNTAVIKPSEVAPATAALIAQLIPEYLDSDVVKVVTGGVAETTELLSKPWDHIFYTGNPTVGKIVLKAAAEHLTPVTLELGGKSPAIVTRSANVAVAARRIAWGKFLNAGQTCVAPDYVLVDAEVADEFEAALVESVKRFYGDDPAQSNDYSRIINTRHHDRLMALLDGEGYDEVLTGGTGSRAELYIAPTILGGVSPEAQVMADEIFGPILPVIRVDSADEAVEFVNARPHPLAMYPFTEDVDEATAIIEATLAGGVVVNHTLFHLTVPTMPFGGVGTSGMGSYHGEAGFNTFSHDQPVLRRPTSPDLSLAYPPYTKMGRAILRKLF